MIRRELNINKHSSFLLLGARGTGKTRLINQQFGDDKPLIIDLLLPRAYQQLLADPESLSGMILPAIREKRLIVIDEVQRVPALLDLAHYHIEKSGAQFGRTGSSARKLKRGGAKLLAGRAITYNLYPLLESEIGSSFDLARALQLGTLPKPTTDSDHESAILYLESYVDTYISQEIIAEQIIRKLPPFHRFLGVAAQSNGRIVNYSSIARDCQTDSSNVQNYFQILEETLIGFTIPGYNASIRKQQRSAPKFYFFDTGVVRAITNQLRIPCQPGTYEWGRLFEAFIISQIKASLDYKRARAQLSYILTKGGAEIDLVVEHPDQKTYCIEIKSGKTIHPGELKNLKDLSKDIKNATPICIYAGDIPQVCDDVVVLPCREGISKVVNKADLV